MSEEQIEVLILEDSPDDRDNMDLLFKEEGDLEPYTLFSNSIPFLKRARELKYAVLVLDFKLSEGPSGLDVLKDLIADDEDHSFYTIIQTGYPAVSMMLDFIPLRPYDFVIKGDGETHYHQLISCIRRGRHRIGRKIEKQNDQNRKFDILLKMAEAIGQNKPMKIDDND